MASIKFPPLKISTFFSLSYFLIALAGIGLVTVFALFTLFRNGEQSVISGGDDLAFMVAKSLESPLENLPAQGPPNSGLMNQLESQIQPHLVRKTNAQFAIYRPSGELLLSSQVIHPTLKDRSSPTTQAADVPPPEIQTALKQNIGHSIRLGQDGRKWFFSAAAIEHNGTLYGVFQLGILYAPAMAETFRTMLYLSLAVLFIVIIIVLIGWQSSAYLSEPVGKLSRVAEQLSQGNLAARATPEGPLEIIHLAETLNQMAARLQVSLDAMQAFVANASHELRTPLTGMKLQVDVLLSGALEDPEVAGRFLGQLDCEIDRLVNLVNDLLDLSQIEGTCLTHVQSVDLFDLACEVHAFWEVRADHAGVAIQVLAEANLPPVKGDPHCLRRLFDNLIDNAIKNTPEDGKVQISLHPSPHSGMLRLEVSDTGPGIAAEHLPHLFERFYRVSPSVLQKNGDQCFGSRSGSGLGLAIVHSIVRTHGGQVGVTSQPGAGTTFAVDLPIQADWS